jgi:hypothetical protein
MFRHWYRSLRSLHQWKSQLIDVAIADINPMTRAALLAIRENPSLQEYHAQIPTEIPLVYHQTMREWLIKY